jgi:K+-transporting ATPase ATPase C chain
MRRQLMPAVMAIVLFTIMTLVYAVGTTLADQALFKHKADGSLVKDASGRIVGSALIGQNFTKATYFHPRPSADDYVAGADGGGVYSYGSNYGPTNQLLVGNVPGVNITDASNPYATPDDPFCVPVQATDGSDNPISDQNGDPVYEKSDDGTYVCDPNTVPQRVLAYRAENGLAGEVAVPVDAVTASASGLDPHISVANAKLQAGRVAEARNLPVDDVVALIGPATDKRALGFLGEPAVNVLRLNLALDQLAS